MDVGSVYGSYYETAKSYMGLRKEEKQAGFAEKVTDKSQVSSEDMTLEEYKEYFNEKMNSLYTHPSQRNRNDIIDITDAAYKRMQTDPEYEKKILDALAKNKAVNFGNYIPQISYMHIDDTYEKCYGYTQGMKENDGQEVKPDAEGVRNVSPQHTEDVPQIRSSVNERSPSGNFIADHIIIGRPGFNVRDECKPKGIKM